MVTLVFAHIVFLFPALLFFMTILPGSINTKLQSHPSKQCCHVNCTQNLHYTSLSDHAVSVSTSVWSYHDISDLGLEKIMWASVIIKYGVY